MFRHILVPLDGSVQAERALPVAARLARASAGMIVLIRITEHALGDEQEANSESSLVPAMVRSERREAQQYLAGIATSHQLAGCPEIVSVQSGPVLAALQTVIATYHIDLLVCCEQQDLQHSSHFLSPFAKKLSSRLAVPLLLLPAHEPRSGSLLEQKYPLTCVVAFMGVQPEHFLISPATALLAGLANRKPAHLHFVPLRSVFDGKAAEQPAVPFSQERVASRSGAALLKEPGQFRKTEQEGEQRRGDMFVLALPRPGDRSDLFWKMDAYPRLLIPTQRREQ